MPAGEGQTAATATATIVNTKGLHARAAARLAKLAATFDARIEVSREGTTVSALSIMGLMMLAAAPGMNVRISATGADAEAAVAAVVALIGEGFGEDLGAPPATPPEEAAE